MLVSVSEYAGAWVGGDWRTIFHERKGHTREMAAGSSPSRLNRLRESSNYFDCKGNWEVVGLGPLGDQPMRFRAPSDFGSPVTFF